MRWDSAAVAAWLQEIPVPDGIISTFCARNISGKVLPHITERHLATELGVVEYIERLRLLTELDALTGRDDAPPGPPHITTCTPLTPHTEMAVQEAWQLPVSRVRADHALVIGQGASSVVCRGTYSPHTGPDCDVAIKKMNAGYILDQTAMQQFCREAKLLTGLRHANIIVTHGATVDVNIVAGVMPCLVMERLERTLREALADPTNTLTPKHKHAIALGIASALQYMHAQSLFHCDLKPENVMLTRAGVAKVADFGLCVEGTDAVIDAGRGTAGYVAPEALGEPAIYTCTDVFALGMIAYELFTALPLYPGVNVAIVSQLVLGNVRPSIPTTVHASYRAVIESCWRHGAWGG